MLINEYTITVQKSKFIGLLYDVNNTTEVKDILEALKKEHNKARHMPYAYIIGNIAKKTDAKVKDIQKRADDIVSDVQEKSEEIMSKLNDMLGKKEEGAEA